MSDPEQPYSLATHADPRVIWAELTELREIVGDVATVSDDPCPICHGRSSGMYKAPQRVTHKENCPVLRSQKWRKP